MIGGLLAEMDELLCFFSKNQPRRPAVIRQVLSNKRTVSNLFWGLRYKILDWLAICPQLEREKFDNLIAAMVKDKLLAEINGQGLCLTELGARRRDDFAELHYHMKSPYLFSRFKVQLWQDILRLLVQIVSEASYGNTHYYVVASSFQARDSIKKWYQDYHECELGQLLGEQLLLFLKNESAEDATIFMQLFYGHEYVAKTAEQIAVNTGWSTRDIEVLWNDLSVKFANFLCEGTSIFKVLVMPLKKTGLLSKSATETYRLYDSGMTVAKIKSVRRLKESTVAEHLLEAAIFVPNFNFKHLISPMEYSIFSKLFKGNIDNWHYEKLQETEPRISFTKFRLYQIEQSKLETVK